jgi:hypothetical protein
VATRPRLCSYPPVRSPLARWLVPFALVGLASCRPNVDDDQYVEYIEKQGALIEKSQGSCPEVLAALTSLSDESAGIGARSKGFYMEQYARKFKKRSMDSKLAFFDRYRTRLEAVEARTRAGREACKDNARLKMLLAWPE